MASPGKDNYRMKSYKNKALNPQEMRRRREEEGIQLRKQKREEQLFKRRNVSLPRNDESMLENPIQDPDISSTVPIPESMKMFKNRLLTNSNRLTTTRNAVWALSNLCRGKNPPPNFSKVSPCLNVLSRLLFSSDPDVLADVCWALSYLSDGSNDKIQAVIDSGVCRRLVELLMHNDYKVVSPALRAVGNIVTGDDIQTQVILNCSALPCLLHLLSSSKESIRKEACWTVSNITAGNRAQIQGVIDANIFPVLIEILQKAEFRTRKEAAWAITNATSGGTPEQIRYLVALGCIKPLCDLLTVMDSKIVQVALNGLENILRLGEQECKQNGIGINPYCALIEEAYGLDKIEFLQSHENQEIYQKAFDLIEHYFGVEDDDSSIVPHVDENQQQFVFQQQEAPMEGFQL
ncbi:hypothetical protein EI555_017288 [Monodon monoceros]|uniref:IBB domain-containing protein n=1 Tax=Monodon monoceros TaxID=40151 RepID=A0A4U1EJ99_MONMO|nr:hypothetical protein EI555_017288 [Monodon monoceros]